MEISRERMMWRVLGALGSLAAIILFVWAELIFYNTADMLHRPLRLGTAGAFCLMAAITCFVVSRILGALDGAEEGVRAVLWKAVAYAAVPVGAIAIAIERFRTANIHPPTSNMKAVYIAGACTLMAGIISLAGERCVHHIASSRPQKGKAHAA